MPGTASSTRPVAPAALACCVASGCLGTKLGPVRGLHALACPSCIRGSAPAQAVDGAGWAQQLASKRCLHRSRHACRPAARACGSLCRRPCRGALPGSCRLGIHDARPLHLLHLARRLRARLHRPLIAQPDVLQSKGPVTLRASDALGPWLQHQQHLRPQPPRPTLGSAACSGTTRSFVRWPPTPACALSSYQLPVPNQRGGGDVILVYFASRLLGHLAAPLLTLQHSLDGAAAGHGWGERNVLLRFTGTTFAFSARRHAAPWNGDWSVECWWSAGRASGKWSLQKMSYGDTAREIGGQRCWWRLGFSPLARLLRRDHRLPNSRAQSQRTAIPPSAADLLHLPLHLPMSSLGYAERLSFREDLGGQLGSRELSTSADDVVASVEQLASWVSSSPSHRISPSRASSCCRRLIAHSKLLRSERARR